MKGVFVKNKLVASRCRCDCRINPLGIGTKCPKFSWIVLSDIRNTNQTAYRILVSESSELINKDIGNLWDSGKIESDQIADIFYAGVKLNSRDKCFWKVKIWDNHGNESDWSDIAFFSVGLLERSDWNSEWIGLDKEPFYVFTYVKCFAPVYLRKEFAVDKEISSVVLYASALGCYEFSINGKKVGEDYFAPGWTDYCKRIYYNSYDVTDLIQSGKNAIGSVLSGSWYHWPNKGESARITGQLEINYTDGTCTKILTDNSWKASLGPERYANILFGESYDARNELTGWNLPDYDDSEWGNPQLGLKWDDACKSVVGAEPDPVIEAYPSVPVKVFKEHRPVKINNLVAKDLYIIDMGTNYAGFVRIKIKNPLRGQTVRIRYGDWLNPDGTLYNENQRLAKNMTDEYICAGRELEIWQPRFTFRGHRYIELTGWSRSCEPDFESITGIELTQGIEQTLEFSSGNEVVNGIYNMVAQTQRANTIEAPTDCSQRDERQGWCGDALFFSKTCYFLRDMQSFYRKWLTGVLDAQHPEGGFARLAPANRGYYGGDRDGMPAWADAGVLFPWNIFQFYGDKEILEQFFPAICCYIDFRMSTLVDGLRDETKFFYGDWNSLDAYWGSEISDWGADTSIAYSAYTIKTIETALEIAKVVNRESEVTRFNEYLDLVREAFKKAYVDENGLKHPTQGNCALALSFDLVNKEIVPKVSEQMLEEFKKHNWKIGAGILATPEVLFAFSQNGLINEAYNVLLNDEYPSWGYMLKCGATAIWEHWGSQRPELPADAAQFVPCDKNETSGLGFDRRVSPNMNSGNHPALGSVGEWIFRNIGGLAANKPGFKEITIKPLIDVRIGHAEMNYLSVSGRISTKWKIWHNDLDMEVEIPPNVLAKLHIPARSAECVEFCNFSKDEIHGMNFNEGNLVIELGSGIYKFKSTDFKEFKRI